MDSLLTPEIILNFGMHLIRRDLASCIRVCRAWQQVLTPLIYHTVQDLHHGTRPSIQAVERYGQHIRSLHLSMEDFRRVTLYRGSFRSNRCRNLQELTLYVNKDDEDPNQEWYIVDLVKRNPGLFRLAIIGNDMLKYRGCIWSSILLEHGLALRELSLRHVFIFRETRSAIYALGPRLCKLELIDCEVDFEIFCDRSTFTSNPQFPNLTELSIDDVHCDMELDDWLSHCPKLHALKWICSEEELDEHNPRHVNVEEFELWAEAPIWSNLHSIDLRCVQHLGVLTDTSVSMILDNCAPLRKLTIDSHHLWVRFYTSLKRHFETLEHIEVPLRSSNSLPQWMWQGILMSCPRLICLIAGGLNACLLDDNPTAEWGRVRERRRENRLIDDRMMDERRRPHLEPRPYNLDCWFDFKKEMDDLHPWVCQKLETLSLGIGGMPKLFALGRWDDKVFERISELKELKVLDVGTIREQDGLNFSLMSGLGQLKDLKNLRTVKFHEPSQWMNKEDALWMLEQWPDLNQDSQNLIRRAGKISKPSPKEILFEKLGVRMQARKRRQYRRWFSYY